MARSRGAAWHAPGGRRRIPAPRLAGDAPQSTKRATLYGAYSLFFRAQVEKDEAVFRVFITDVAMRTAETVTQLANRLPSREDFSRFFDRHTSAIIDALADVRAGIQVLAGHRPPPFEEADYRAHIHKHYRHLHLEALAGDQLLYRDVDLQQVFIPQDARDCGEWLPETLEVPGPLTLDAVSDPMLRLAELHEHKRFRDTTARGVLGLLDEPTVPHRVILGAPGAGKSSLTRIRLLAWAEAPTGRPLPILVELRRFHHSRCQDFLEYLDGDGDLLFRFRQEELRVRLAAGTAELLFDGLDEIFSPASREAAARQIVLYAEEFPRAHILVTSRLIGYPGRFLRNARFGHWLLADFDDPKIEAFIEHWTTGAIREPGDRPIVQRRINDALRNPVVRELAGNPLLLTLMAVLARESDLPRDLGSLYKQAADLLLKQWDARRYLATQVDLGSVIIDQKDKQDLLRDLAWKMQTGPQRALGGNLIGDEELKDAMDGAFQHRIPDSGLRRKAISSLIDQLIERNYILCHVGGAQFAFVHRGFLEFFASEHLLQIITTRPDEALAEIKEIYETHSENAAWRQVLILAATRFEAAVADKVLSSLLDQADAKVVADAAVGQLPNRFILACAVLGRAREPLKLIASCAKARSSLEGWLQTMSGFENAGGWVRLLSESFPDDRTRRILIDLSWREKTKWSGYEAVMSLAQYFPDPDTRALLTELARSSGDSVAGIQAVMSLAQYFPDPDTRALLTELARSSGDSVAGIRAVALLADNFPDPDTRALLTELARSSDDTRVRSEAVRSLADNFHDPDTRALLIELARSSDDTRVRSEAVMSLAQYFPDPDTRALLTELARSSGDSVAGIRAVALLADNFPDPDTRALLTELARSSDDSVAGIRAVALLADNFPDPDTRALLTELARSSDDTRVRSEAVRSLADNFHDPDTRTLLTELAGSSGDSVARSEAVAALANNFHDPDTRALLTELARSSGHTRVRSEAVAALANNFHDPDTRALLAELARSSGHTEARSQAVAALANNFPDPDTRALLTELARSSDDTEARSEAVRSLADNFLDLDTRALLTELARSGGDTEARRQAVRSLAGNFHDPDTRALLIELARSSGDTEAGRTAVAALANNFPDPDTRALLIELARSSGDTEARSQAVASLANNFPDPDTRALLIELARSSGDTRVRSQAVRSLADNFPDPDTRALLIELARSSGDTEARSQAIR